VLDEDDVVEGIVLLRKGAEADRTLDALHEKIATEQRSAAARGQAVPHSTAATGHYTTHTVLRNLTHGVCWSR